MDLEHIRHLTFKANPDHVTVDDHFNAPVHKPKYPRRLNWDKSQGDHRFCKPSFAPRKPSITISATRTPQAVTPLKIDEILDPFEAIYPTATYLKPYIAGSTTYDRPHRQGPILAPKDLSAREKLSLYIENELKPENVPEVDALQRKLKKFHLKKDEIHSLFDQARVFKEQHRISNVIKQVRDRSQEARTQIRDTIDQNRGFINRFAES